MVEFQEVDARPSDAIALALLMNSPIYINEAVMEEVSIKVPSDVEGLPSDRGLAKFITNFKTEREKKQQEEEEGMQEIKEKLEKSSREEIFQVRNNRLIEFLFDRDPE